MEHEITMDMILSTFKNYSDSKKLRDIKAAIVSMCTPPDQLINEHQSEIEEQIERLIKEDKNLENESALVYSKGGYYKKRKNITPPGDGLSSDYIGIAGECAVMSELIFHGYNANRMMIDEGVDIIAVKDNLYFYIQVKTTVVKNGRIYCQIPKNRFDQYISNQIRYIIVARYKVKDKDRNMFFVFNSQDIDKGVYGRYIKRGEDSISIKIRFNEKSGIPYLYDDKESDVSWHMNNFNL